MYEWIKLYKKINEWEWFQESKTLHVWIYLLTNAADSMKKYKKVRLCPGQLITTVKEIVRQTNISTRSVRTALNRLKTTKEITIKTTNGFTIITIRNYGSYQEKIFNYDKRNDKRNDKRVTNERQTSDKRTPNFDKRDDFIPYSSSIKKEYKNKEGGEEMPPPTFNYYKQKFFEFNSKHNLGLDEKHCKKLFMLRKSDGWKNKNGVKIKSWGKDLEKLMFQEVTEFKKNGTVETETKQIVEYPVQLAKNFVLAEPIAEIDKGEIKSIIENYRKERSAVKE